MLDNAKNKVFTLSEVNHNTEIWINIRQLTFNATWLIDADLPLKVREVWNEQM